MNLHCILDTDESLSTEFLKDINYLCNLQLDDRVLNGIEYGVCLVQNFGVPPLTLLVLVAAGRSLLLDYLYLVYEKLKIRVCLGYLPIEILLRR